MDMEFEPQNTITTITSNDNVISINQKINAQARWRIKRKHKVIGLIFSQTKLKHNKDETIEPNTRGVL